jgi:hypothetical protein
MIRQEGGKWVAYCDGECGASGLRSFQQTVNYISRAEGWDSRRSHDGQWHNYCPACGEYANPEQELAGIHFGRRASPDDD